MLLDLLAALLAVVADPRPAQAPPSQAAPASQVAKAHVYERVAVLGASLSDGVNADPGWGAAFRASTARDCKLVAELASARMFLGPAPNATAQVDQALRTQPTLVLAVDFLFWFGYGTRDAEGRELAGEEARLALLEKGLALLDKFECTLVVGDFPDMSRAVGVILRPPQMPQSETLGRLNARFAEWARGKPNLVPIALSSWVRDLTAGKPLAIGAHTYEPEVTARWMQDDRLHPTFDGLAALATLVNLELEARKLVAKAEHVTEVALVLERARSNAGSSSGSTTGTPTGGGR